MLSHLRLHRRAPSNLASPQHDRFPAPDPAAQREHPQQPRDVSLRPDTRPRSPNASQMPPKLPPITRVASTGSEELASPLFDAALPDTLEAGQPPARPAYDDTSRAGFIGGVALQNYRRAADQSKVPDLAPAMPSQLTRSKPPPPPIDTGVATRPTMPSNKQAKASWVSAPGDLHVSAANAPKRPGGPRLASEPAPVPALESHKGRKGLPFLKNPVSSLLMRRKTPQAVAEPEPAPPSYDPRIRGTRFHDFSAPRPKKPISSTDITTTRLGTASTAHESADQGELTRVISNSNANLDHGSRRGESSPSEESAPPVPPKDESSSSLRTSSSAASRTTQIAPLRNPATASVRTTASRQLSSSQRLSRGSVASAVPRHMKSTSSRFSFDMIGAAEQERVLEERHRQREQEKKTDDPGHGDARFDDFDEDFDYDAMIDDDGLEERIPGVNADYEDEEDLEAAMDPDNDQENFAGFVFQRSNPASSLASPNTPAMLATPRDATGKVIGFAMTKDITPVLPSADSPMFPGPFEVPMPDDTSGLGIEEPESNVAAAPAAVYRPSQPTIAADADPSPRVQHDDIYFDDGLADELDFEHDGAPFDESIFDHNDTDQYGRPIPGAFAQAKEAMQAAQQQQQPGKRDSDVTSSTSGRSATVQSTGHTSLDVAPQQHQNHQEDDGPLAPKPPPAEPIPDAIGAPGQDLAYQAALAEAAQKAAASGKFRRDSSSDVLAGLADVSLNNTDDLPDRGYVNDDYDYDDGDGFANDYEDDFDFDDEAIIAEANASALANDSDGFYGQEFGFYSAPLPTHPLHHSHQLSSIANTNTNTHTPSSSSSFSSLSSAANSTTSTNGVLTTENLFHYANGGYFGPPTSQLARTTSGRAAAALREPNLTPITERSEYSNRNSVMSFTLPPAIGSSSSDLPRSASASGYASTTTAMGSSPTPGLAQLALIPDEVDCGSMSLAGLMKLRNKAWGGGGGGSGGGGMGGGGGSQSQGSGIGSWSSSREGSPRSERAAGPYMSPGSGPGGGGEHGYMSGHVRVNSGLSLWSCSEEVDDEDGAVVPPPRPGSAGALGGGGSGNGYAAAGLYMGSRAASGGVVAPLPQRPQSLFLPPQGQLPVLSPSQHQMVGSGGSACSPVLEGEEADAEEFASASTAALNAYGFSLAPALPLLTSRVTGRLAQQQQQDRTEIGGGTENGEQPARRPGPGHRKRGSADSISYVKDGEGSGDRWVLERRRTAESGEVEVLGREVVAGGRI